MLLVCLLSTAANAGNLTGFWAENGGYKMTRQELYRNNTSSDTISLNWDGTTWKMKGAKNETVGGALYLLNGSSVDSSSTTVTISSFTGTSGDGFAAQTVLCNGVTDYTTRPYELFVASYTEIRGMTVGSWDPVELDQRDLPRRFRRPCTLTTIGSDQSCIADGTTALWTSRPAHNHFMPDILVPNECKGNFMVFKSSSQAIWLDVYLSTSLVANSTYYANLTIKEGVAVSTVIPVAIYVWNFTLPDAPSVKNTMEMSSYDINYYHHADHFPATGGIFKQTRDNYMRYLKRHKFAATMGDHLTNDCSQSTKDFPCPSYQEALAGTMYSRANGYGNAPGVGLGDSIYSIATYGGWPGVTWSTSSLGGASGFDTNVSSWGYYFKNNYPNVRSFLYLMDEPSLQSQFDSLNLWSTWMSTVTSAQTAGYFVNPMTTMSALRASTLVPYVTMPMTTFTSGMTSSWTTVATQYQTAFSTQMWMYNGHPPNTGTAYATEDDGLSPTINVWAMVKKGIQGQFYWQSTNWSNPGQQIPIDNDLFNKAKTFGFVNVYTSFTVNGMSSQPTCDYFDVGGSTYSYSASSTTNSAPNIRGYLYTLKTGTNPTSPASATLTKIPNQCGLGSCPSCTGDTTITASSHTTPGIHILRGETGFNYGNGDGVLLVPGTNTVDPYSSAGFDGPMGTWRLKMIRRGIQDGDYLTLGAAVSASTTTAIINAVVPSVFWENDCHDHGDCTYFYGGRSWSDDPNVLESRRQQLGALVTSAASVAGPRQMRGRGTFKGNVKFK